MTEAEPNHAVEIDGARITWRVAGAANPPAVVLLHGFPLHGEMWRGQQPTLARTHRVITPDLRGFGGSTLGGWADAGAEPSVDRYADDVVAVLDAAGVTAPVPVVGFSMGGYVALAMLRRHAERVNALALVDSRVPADDDAARAGRLKMAEHAAEWGAERIAGMMRPKLLATDAADRAVRETLAQIAGADPAAIASAQRAMAARPDSSEAVARFAGAVLCVAGEHDEISPPAEMRAIAASATRGAFREIAGAGHLAPIERPEAVADALAEWLGSFGRASYE